MLSSFLNDHVSPLHDSLLLHGWEESWTHQMIINMYEVGCHIIGPHTS